MTERRPKILVFPAWYPSRENPVYGIFVRELAKASAAIADVVVLCNRGCRPMHGKLWCVEEERDPELTQGIPTYNCYIRRTWPVTRATSLWASVKAFRYVAAKTFQPDIIHAHVYTAGFQAVLAGRTMGVPVVITEHATIFPRKGLGRFERWEARFAFERAQMVMPVSRPLQDAIEQLGIRANFRIVPNTVDTALFHPGDPPRAQSAVKQLITICGLDLSDKKGLHHLLAALARLREVRQDWHLNIVGEGPARGRHEDQVRQLGLEEHVTFHGMKSKPQVADMLRDADVFVLPSLFETFSLVTAEALASGVPVVVTRCGGPEHFVTPADGIIVPPGDAEALTTGLDQMLREHRKYSPADLAQRLRDRFGFEAVANQLDQVYREVLTSYGSKSKASQTA